MPLQKESSETLGQRKAHWEHIRNNNVPRYLFRMFTSQSGGGSEMTINNATKVPSLYTKTEAEIYKMVQSHYLGLRDVLTEFSSWAASLHAVLFLARHAIPKPNIHVAMLDRERLDGEVLIFWLSDILDEKIGDVEYLAHGRIRGTGYTAVPFEQLILNGLYGLCPQVRRSRLNKEKAVDFGHNLRKKMFSATPVDVSDGDIETAKMLGALFGELSVPTTVALLCLQPRNSSDYKDTAIRVIQSLGLKEVYYRNLATGYWCQTGAVHTRDTNGSTARRYRDVRQWIKLLRTISNHDFSRTGEKRKRLESDAEYDSGTESDTDVEEYSNRVRRSYGLRSRPTTPTAKKAEADEYDLEWLDEEDVKEDEIEDVEMGEVDVVKKEINEEDFDEALPDEIMQDRYIAESGDTVMADEEIRSPEGRSYVCVPSLEPGRPGVIVVTMDDYGTVVDHIYFPA